MVNVFGFFYQDVTFGVLGVGIFGGGVYGVGDERGEEEFEDVAPVEEEAEDI